MKKVTKLPSEPKFTHKLRVAAYARVSTGKDAMLHSLTAQIDYYKTKIRATPEWIFAGVYADEAKTGTKETREAFERLIADCRDGKIDMVLTKSISRFARNTVTLLQTVRMCKEWGGIFSLKRKTSIPLTARASCCLPSCPVSRRRKAARSPRM